jgi:hypothetical protein
MFSDRVAMSLTEGFCSSIELPRRGLFAGGMLVKLDISRGDWSVFGKVLKLDRAPAKSRVALSKVTSPYRER